MHLGIKKGPETEYPLLREVKSTLSWFLSISVHFQPSPGSIDRIDRYTHSKDRLIDSIDRYKDSIDMFTHS